MTRDNIKALALECGFSLKEQPDGSMDPNPYVYDFAKRLIAAEREACVAVCEQLGQERGWDVSAYECEVAIRARSDK